MSINVVRWLGLFRGKEFRSETNWAAMAQYEATTNNKLSAEFYPASVGSQIDGAQVGLRVAVDSSIVYAYDGDAWTERSGEKYIVARWDRSVSGWRKPSEKILRQIFAQRGHKQHTECVLVRPNYVAVVVREKAKKKARRMARFLANYLNLPIEVVNK